MSLFLIVLLSVLLFVPGTVAPFTEGGQERIVAANRIADSLSEGQLGDPATPQILNESCTVAFFNDSSPAGCHFTGTNLRDRVGLNERLGINVTLYGNVSGDTTLLCWDEDASPPEVVFVDDAGCDVPFSAGPAVPTGSGATVTARRVVTIGRTNATLLVEVW